MQVRFNKLILQLLQQVRGIISFALLCFLMSSCTKPGFDEIPRSVWDAPVWFPKMEIPADNEFSEARWELGKKLFYETRLSIDNSISCASCHDPSLAFSDNKATSPGVFDRPGMRNASMLANIGYDPNLLREGGIPTLEMQVLVPIQEHNEFNHNIVDIAIELNADSLYHSMAMEAYNNEVNPFVITRALANFERSFISGNSSFDRYFYKGSRNALSPAAKAGMQLFFSPRLQCSECHSGVFFTSFEFANNGLKEMYADSGRMRLTGLETDRAVFKIPSLRNIEVTGPYLHDGSIETLEEIIDLYSDGGFQHSNKSSILANPINLNEIEKLQLLAFLRSLSDESFLNDERFKQ